MKMPLPGKIALSLRSWTKNKVRFTPFTQASVGSVNPGAVLSPLLLRLGGWGRIYRPGRNNAFPFIVEGLKAMR